MRKPVGWLVVAAVFGVLMWFTAVYWGSHSEGFKFVEDKIRASRDIQRRVGDIQKVTLPALGEYRERFVNSDRSVKLTVGVVGTKGTITIHAVLKKKNGVWSIAESSIGSERVNLD